MCHHVVNLPFLNDIFCSHIKPVLLKCLRTTDLVSMLFIAWNIAVNPNLGSSPLPISALEIYLSSYMSG